MGRDAEIAKLHAKRDAWRKQGLCYSCGSDPEPGHKLCPEHLRYHRQFKKELRAERRAGGRCCDCDAPAKGWRCPQHAAAWSLASRAREAKRKVRRAKMQQWRRAFVERRLKACICTHCSAPVEPGRWICTDCTADTVARASELRVERRVTGLCKCGRDPRAGFSTCEKCARRARKYARLARKRRRAKGICRSCFRPAASGSSMCLKHRTEHAENKRRLEKRRRGIRNAQRRAA